MKRLLLMGMVGLWGCGGEAPPSGGVASPSAVQGPQVKLENGLPRSPLDTGTAPKPPAGDADSAITALEKLAAKIEKDDNGEVVVVNLTNTQVSDAGLVHLKGLTNLRQLNLRNTRISDAGLVHLKGLTKMKVLILTEIPITDAGLAHLEGLAKLEKLILYDTQITDAGLVHLKGLTGLKSLNLTNTKITDSGLSELKEALPNCKITGK